MRGNWLRAVPPGVRMLLAYQRPWLKSDLAAGAALSLIAFVGRATKEFGLP